MARDWPTTGGGTYGRPRKSLPSAPNLRFIRGIPGKAIRPSSYCLPHRGRRLDIDDDRVIRVDHIVGRMRENAVALSLTLTLQELQALDAAHPPPSR